MIQSKTEACRVLGVSISATEADIKTAFKSLVKIYHPDTGMCTDTTIYNEIVEAYDFLCKKQEAPGISHVENMMGAPVPPRKRSSEIRRTASNSDYEAWEKKVKKHNARKKAEFEQKTKDYSQMMEKQEADYKRAMDAINALRTARAIEAMVWGNTKKDDEQK